MAVAFKNLPIFFNDFNIMGVEGRFRKGHEEAEDEFFSPDADLVNKTHINEVLQTSTVKGDER